MKPIHSRETDDRNSIWQQRYEQLRDFALREGHCRVPARYRENGVSLGRWVHAQRCKRDGLPKERAAALELLPGWFWKGQDAKWDRAYELLQRFVMRVGSALVPKKHMEDDFGLGVWVMHQRSFYRKGKLSAERIERLEQVPGWIWDPVKLFESEDDEQQSAPPAPRRELANASVDELAESIWAALWGLGAVKEDHALALCATKLHSDGLINSGRLIKGEALEDLIREAVVTATEYNFLDRPATGSLRSVIRDADFFESNDWEMCVKRALSRKSLKRPDAVWGAARWARDNLGLEFIDVQFGSLIWEQLDSAIGRLLERGELELNRAAKLKIAAHDASKTTPAPLKTEDPGEHQEKPEKKKTRRVVTLFTDDPDEVESKPATPRQTAGASYRHSKRNADKWSEGYQRLKSYASREGTSQVPKRFKEDDGYQLGQWVCEQRKARHVIPSDRKEALEQLPAWVWVAARRGQSWEESYTLLVRFVEREGHAKVPQSHLENDYRLGNWVSFQRANRAKLSADRRAALERLSGWAWRLR